MLISDWTHDNQKEALDFLNARFASCMFLLGNVQTYGPRLGESHVSGNFKVIYESGRLIGVYSLLKNGNLLIQLESDSISDELIDHMIPVLKAEGIPIAGVLGPWNCASRLWERLLALQLVPGTRYREKEILYCLDDLSPYQDVVDDSIRYLTEDDFAIWFPLHQGYLVDEKLLHHMGDEKARQAFRSRMDTNTLWGVFDDKGNMIATNALNCKAGDIGQVGGVYTKPEFRKQGIAKRAMKVLLRNSARDHGLKRIVLFTGLKNYAAQALYESLGFKQVGSYGIIIQ